MSLDYPRAWQIAKATQFSEHDPKCSYAQTGGGVLCDCDVINKHPEFLDKTKLFTEDGKVFRSYVPEQEKTKPSVKEAMDVLSEAIMADLTPGSYGYSWLCNIAMPLWDQRDKLDLKEPADCNKMAEILLRHFFQRRMPEQTYPEKKPTPP